MNWALFSILLLFGLVAWYLYYGVECFLNGGMGGWKMPFECLMDDVRWNMPITGRNAKAAYIREIVGTEGDGALCSSVGSWNHQEIRDSIARKPGSLRNLDCIVGKAMLPGRIHFVLTHIALPFGPAASYFFGMRILA